MSSSSNLGNVSTANFSPVSKTKSMFDGTKEFMKSNSIIAKVAFLFLVLIVFILLLRLGISIISYFMRPSSDPTLVDGMADGTQMLVIPQNPAIPHSVPILRSVNQEDGIEFTWSIWTYIKNLKPDNLYKHVFHKGNDNINPENGINFPNNAPGLYITPDTNNFVIIMNTFKEIQEEIIVEDIPLNKWINIIIRVENHNLDVYINGTIVKRHILNSVPKQNYGDVFVNMNGGFSGYLSKLRYYNYGVNVRDIIKIVKDGPSLKSEEVDLNNSFPPYLSLKWYFSK